MTFAQWLDKLTSDEMKALAYFPSLRYYEPYDEFQELDVHSLDHLDKLLNGARRFHNESISQRNS